MRWMFPGVLVVGLILLWLRPQGGVSSADLRAAYLAQVPQVVPSMAGASPSARPIQIPTPARERVMPSRSPVATVFVPTMAPSWAPPPSAIPTAPPPTATEEPSPPVSALPAYVVPVQPWSAATYGTCHHDYPATDIFAPTGTVVVAVTDGRVEFVSHVDTWNAAEDGPATRGGLSVALVGDHDHVRYYYSHLSVVDEQVRPGTHVSAGQVLGAVGNSGNAKPTPPHLHFGISQPTTPEDWATRRGTVDPAPYLAAWSAGRMHIPDVFAAAGGVCGRTAAPSSLGAARVPQRDRPLTPVPTSVAAPPSSAAPAPVVQPPGPQPTGRVVAPTYRLRVTRQGMVGQRTANGHIIVPNDVFVSLPCRCVVSKRDGHEYQVRLSSHGRSLIAPVWDVGPYATNDDFWNPQRQGFPDLPVGWPQDHAAFFEGYNNRQAELGYVRFPSAVDIGDGAFWSLGLVGAQGEVDVTFLWLGDDPGPNPVPRNANPSQRPVPLHPTP